MANETVFSNIETVAAFLASETGPALKAKLIMPNLCHIENFKVGSDSIKLRVKGTLAATAATEATDHATSQYDQTTPATLSVAEFKVYAELSDKAALWSGAQIAEIVDEAVNACGQKLDTDAMALFDGFSTSVGTTNTDLSDLKLAEASYKLEANNAPGPYAYVLHPKQWWDVREDVVASGASLYVNPQFVTLFSGQPAANGFKGSYFDVPVFVSTNTESVTANVDWSGACIAINHALGLGLGGDVMVETDRNIKKGVHEIAVSIWYDVKEYRDLCGCGILSGKTS